MKTKLLDILTFSEKRENLLILLKLEERNLVYRVGENYELNDIGMIFTNALIPLVKTTEFIEKPSYNQLKMWLPWYRKLPRQQSSRHARNINCNGTTGCSHGAACGFSAGALQARNRTAGRSFEIQ